MWCDIKSALLKNRNISEQTEWIRQEIIGSQLSYIAEQVFLAGASSDSSSSAFWVGYQSAIQALFGSVLDHQIASIVVNENKSFKPSEWGTTLFKTEAGYILSGKKDFITAFDQIDLLLVSANELINQRQIARICLVPNRVKGMEVVDLEMPILKHLKKSRGVFNEIKLPGKNILVCDGYDRYIKPFRVYEDFYVSLSMLGYLIRLLMVKGVNISAQLPKLATFLGAIQCIEKRLMDYVDAESKSPVFMVESYILEVSNYIELLVDCFNTEKELADYRRDMMVFKIGKKARDIRYQRALKGILEVCVV